MENAASVVTKFGQVLVEEYREIRAVGDKIVHLRDEVASMNSILRMLAEADEESIDHHIREWTKQVRELASDAEDCVDIYMLNVNRPLPLPRPPVDPGTPFNSVRHLLGRAKILPATLWYHLDTLVLQRGLAADIQGILARMVIINERRGRYAVSLNREALWRSAASLAPVMSVHEFRPANDPGRLVGMTNQVNDLAEKLRLVEDDNNMKVFSIVGFGGMGKTTLAMEVCRELEVNFQHQAQVSVTQAFDPDKDLQGLLKRILHQMVKRKSEEDAVAGIDHMDVPKLADMLQELLRDKRYLIVIDDVWTIPAWDAIRSILPADNKHNSRVVVTTRLQSVAEACSSVTTAAWWGDHLVHHMRPLEVEASEKLFISRAFGGSIHIPEELTGSMQNILKKCGGLPLAIVSMASLLARYTYRGSEVMWDRICYSIGSHMEWNPTQEGMRQILTLSYTHLPQHLKTCMLYFSIFPEDYEIKKKRLLSRWIAEGLVGEKRGLTLLEVAESYFDELISRNMIVPGSLSRSGRVKTCRVHTMMLEVMLSTALEANFVSLVGGQQCEGESHGNARRLSIQGGRGLEVSPSSSTKMRVAGLSVEHVRSLSTFHPHGHRKLMDKLGELTLLRVLDLEDSKAVCDTHMKHVCRLFLLKFLNLNGTDISVMPKEVGHLVHLQTLSIRDTYLKCLPETVTNLVKLECLYFSSKLGWDCNWRLPTGLGKMKALRVVDKSILEDDADVAKEIGELTQLTKLNIFLSCSHGVLEELALALSKTNSLRALLILDHGYERRLNVLLQIPSPPLLLRSMRISGDIDGLPQWFGSLSRLVKINISWTILNSEEILGILCKLPNLLNLILWRKSYINDLLVARSCYPFPLLKQLAVISDHEEQKSVIFEEGSMKMLEKLEVVFGEYEKSVTGVEHLQSLKEVVLTGKRGNDSLNQAVEQLTSESNGRSVANQFKVVPRYE